MKLDAVILAAGSGSRMVELTRGRPKCLLPVGNHSMIWFAITSLRSIGVSRIIILVPDTQEQDIKQYCHKKFNSIKGLILEFASVSVKADCGTAESILSIRDKIREDFIVFSCDSIVDPKSLLALLNHYRLYDPMLTMLLADNPAYFQRQQTPGRREKETYPRDVIAIEPLEKLDQTTTQEYSTNKIVFLHSERDLGKNLRIKNRELALHPSLEVYSQFLDTHIYILKRQALDILSQHKDNTVLKGEIIPLLIARQFSRLENDSYDRGDDDDDDAEDLSGFARRSDHELELKERLESFNPRNVAQSNYLHKPKLSRPTACHALVTKNPVAHRANTLRSYLECNREAKTILNLYGVKNLTFIKDCLIGDDTKVGEKCLLKGGSIGNGCKIGDKVKLFNCVIMDNVEIESNVTISESIISSNSRIGSKCDLKSCIVGQRQVIAAGRKANCEVIIDDGYVIDLSDPLVADND
uniref:Translation initiation factor eIF2B subunit gamma n=1 Tax=Aceria tosichella TaxID=561515 RepID=A0A6G1S539_9ACAR